MDGITVPSSVFVNGQWATAHWMADVVDDETGELMITATLAGEGGHDTYHSPPDLYTKRMPTPP